MAVIIEERNSFKALNPSVRVVKLSIAPVCGAQGFRFESRWIHKFRFEFFAECALPIARRSLYK